MQPLGNDQINSIANILITDNGIDLDDTVIAEQILLLLEDVAGFEIASGDTVNQTIELIRSAYHDAASQADENRKD